LSNPTPAEVEGLIKMPGCKPARWLTERAGRINLAGKSRKSSREEFMTERQRDSEVIAADFLLGERVVDRRGEDLGRLEDIMADAATGRIRYAVLSFGSIFGMGEKLFALPWQVLRPDPENRRFILDIDREQLKNAPAFDRHNWPRMGDPQWGGEIHRFYGQTPYWEEIERVGFLGGEPPEAGRKLPPE
jgi:sporulation protein YlmC with PRC-barrel domain